MGRPFHYGLTREASFCLLLRPLRQMMLVLTWNELQGTYVCRRVCDLFPWSLRKGYSRACTCIYRSHKKLVLVFNLRRRSLGCNGGLLFVLFTGSFSSVPGLYPLDASSIPSAVTTKNTSIVRCALGAQTTPQLGTTLLQQQQNS